MKNQEKDVQKPYHWELQLFSNLQMTQINLVYYLGL